jgi:two-component system, LytTR family, response regulator
MRRILVVDDEPLGRDRLVDLLEDEPDAEVIATAADGLEAIEAIRTSRPDLVFLDVQMPRLNGLDVVREVGPTNMPATIFVTAYDQYALQAFDSAAIDYLVKPFRNDRFWEAFRRARRRIEADTREQVHQQLMALLQGALPAAPVVAPTAPTPAPKHLDCIAVQMKGRTRVIPVARVDYVTASRNYAELHVGEQRYVIRESMQTLEDRLDPERFMRVHRSAIVRVDLIDSLLRSEGSDYEVQLKGGVRLPVGRSRRDALERRLGMTS